MDIHTHQLRYFLELAKCLNFTKAAMNLYIAQPALSQQIADLEKQLGVTLFERTSRSVSLTAAGALLQKAAPDILSRLESVHQQLRSAQAGLRGNLKIGYLSSFQSGLSGLMGKYRESYPDVAVELFCGSIREMQTAILSQNADIVFSVLHQDMLDEIGRLSKKDLWQEGMCLVMRKNHPFALSGGQDYSLLQNTRFILMDDSFVPEFRNMVHRICAERSIPISEITTSKSGGPIVIQLETGMDASFFSTRDSNNICAYHSDLVSFPVAENCLSFCAVWDPKSKNPALPLFLDTLDSMVIHTENQ